MDQALNSNRRNFLKATGALAGGLYSAADAEAAARPLTQKEKLDRIDYIIQELNVLSETLKYAGDATRRESLPVFERKKNGFIPTMEEIDPVLKKKPAEGARP